MMYLLFEEEVEYATKPYHIVNNLVLAFNIVLSFIMGYIFGSVPFLTLYSTRSSFSFVQAIAIFILSSLLSTLFYVIVRVIILKYGESVRQSCYNHIINERLLEIKNK